MKDLLKRVIVGGILSTVFAVGAFAFFRKGGIGLLPLYLLNIPIGTISYTLIKSVTDWAYKHFTFIGKNVIQGYLMDKIVWPIVASGWWVILITLGSRNN